MKKYSTILLVLILAFISSAQIKIKERVEIAPESHNYVPSNPVNFPDSIYEYPGNKPLNQNIPHYGPASTIILDSPGRVVVSVIESEAPGSAKIDLIMRAPEPLTIKEDANHNLGFCWTSPEYPAGTSLDFGIWWWYNSWGTIYEGYEFGAIMTELGNGVYQIGFEAAGDDMDYNELVIIVEKEEVREPPALSVALYPEEITTGESSAIYITFDEAYWCSIPPEIKANVEIIKGTEYGNLFNYFTGEKGKIFTNLDFFYGQYLFVHFIAEGIAAEKTDTIIFRVSTTDPEIEPEEALLIIKPSPIYVYTVPEVLGADDTANVIIKHRLEDGTIEDFPPEQTFELAVLDGCVNGNFMVNGVIDVYFADAVQPIKFVTADSLDPEFDKVLIRVGTDLSGYSRPIGGGTGKEKILTEKQKELNTQFEKLIAEKKAKTEAKKKEEGGTEPQAPVLSQCSTEEEFYGTNGYANVLVQDECDDYSCSEVIIKPSFTYEYFPNGTFNEDPCNDEQNEDTSKTVSGIFSVLWGKTAVTAIEYFSTENLSACYESVNGKWKFGTTLPLYPYYQTIMDICLTNIIKKGYKYLYDISEIQTVWNDPDICEAKKDLEGHKKYPSKVRAGGYVFLEVEMSHEMAHGQDFQWVIDSLQNDFLYPTLGLLEVTCGNYDEENKKANNENDAKLIYFKYLQKVIAGETVGGVRTYNGFEQRLFIGYDNHTNQSFIVDGKQVDHENYINSRPTVTNTINVLLSEFENIWNCN